MLEDGAPGRLRALGLRAGEADGDRVVHERLPLVDDRRRQILEPQRGDEFSQPNGERRLFHGWSIIRRMRPHEETISVGGTGVHTWIGGQGDAAAGAARRRRQPRLDALARSGVRALHRVGADPSRASGAPATPTGWRASTTSPGFYLWFIEAAGLGRPHLLGHSIGGWTAAEMATMSPGTIDRLVLVAPVGLKPEQGEILDVFYYSPAAAPHDDGARSEDRPGVGRALRSRRRRPPRSRSRRAIVRWPHA